MSPSEARCHNDKQKAGRIERKKDRNRHTERNMRERPSVRLKGLCHKLGLLDGYV